MNPSIIKMKCLLHAAEHEPDATRNRVLDAIASMSDEEVLALMKQSDREPVRHQRGEPVRFDRAGKEWDRTLAFLMDVCGLTEEQALKALEDVKEELAAEAKPKPRTRKVRVVERDQNGLIKRILEHEEPIDAPAPPKTIRS